MRTLVETHMGNEAKHPGMIVLTNDPYNAEPTPELLRQSFLTPVDLFYIRNHGPIPQIDAESFRLIVDGLVQRPLSLSFDALRRDFPHVTVTATLECAGNRRQELIDVAEIPGETPWNIQAIGNATWGGVPLREVLAAAGVSTEAQHIAFVGLDSVKKADGGGFGGSIPLEKAMHPEVLLAYEMNGRPLEPAHGYPVRVVIPGYIGARSIKWLGGISVQDQPSTNFAQARAYKRFPPGVSEATADWDHAPMIYDFDLTAAICVPPDAAQVAAGPVNVQGYALSGQGHTVARVEISADGGATWREAMIEQQDGPWTWCFWQATVELAPGQHELCARAWDSAGATQPANLEDVWNFKGYMNNAWHRVKIEAS
jgi:sulfite oxidase